MAGDPDNRGHELELVRNYVRYLDSRVAEHVPLRSAMAELRMREVHDTTAHQAECDVQAYLAQSIQFAVELEDDRPSIERRRHCMSVLSHEPPSRQAVYFKSILVLKELLSPRRDGTSVAEVPWDVRAATVERAVRNVEARYQGAEKNPCMLERLYRDALDAEGVSRMILEAERQALDSLTHDRRRIEPVELTNTTLDVIQKRAALSCAWHVATLKGEVPLPNESCMSAAGMTVFVNAAEELRRVNEDLATGAIDAVDALSRTDAVITATEVVLADVVSTLLLFGASAGVFALVMSIVGETAIGLLVAFVAGLCSCAVLDRAADVAGSDIVAGIDRVARLCARAARSSREPVDEESRDTRALVNGHVSQVTA